MASAPKMAALIHNDGMAPTLDQGSIAVAEYPLLKVERWQIIAYRSQVSLDLATKIALRDSQEFAALGEEKTRSFYAAHFKVFGALRINRVGRVIGLPGEKLSLSDEGIKINDKKIAPPSQLAAIYSSIPGPGSVFEIPEHQVFVLQDNLVQGNDSRTLGTFKLTSVLGALNDVLAPMDVKQILNQPSSSRVPADVIADLEEQHGPAISWFKPN